MKAWMLIGCLAKLLDGNGMKQLEMELAHTASAGF